MVGPDQTQIPTIGNLVDDAVSYLVVDTTIFEHFVASPIFSDWK
jgi:hypothetical protein